jgi:ribosomal protein L3 glutamine methyltransferase
MIALIFGSLSLPFETANDFLSARLTTEEKDLLATRLAQRIDERIPVPYLINQAWFCELNFYVDERVLIPRSPIAELIAQQFSPWVEVDKVENILDLCTGSGCIAIACQYAFPHATIIASDLSEKALEVAKINCERHGLDTDLTLIQSDVWENIPAKRFDLIVSNPPYVGDEEMDSLPEEYRHEPKSALRSGNSGLELVETILSKAHNYLADKGILVVEVGNSEQALVQAYPDLPFTWLEFEKGGQGVFLLTREQLAKQFKG